ncbi:hypothetical protein FPQ18DRAFT_405784 [Pyronema domesticum]|nr:hypothetical protein FPQ18DRAFT_405784 [Pyronema domesticum]
MSSSTRSLSYESLVSFGYRGSHRSRRSLQLDTSMLSTGVDLPVYLPSPDGFLLPEFPASDPPSFALPSVSEASEIDEKEKEQELELPGYEPHLRSKRYAIYVPRSEPDNHPPTSQPRTCPLEETVPRSPGSQGFPSRPVFIRQHAQHNVPSSIPINHTESTQDSDFDEDDQSDQDSNSGDSGHGQTNYYEDSEGSEADAEYVTLTHGTQVAPLVIPPKTRRPTESTITPANTPRFEEGEEEQKEQKEQESHNPSSPTKIAINVTNTTSTTQLTNPGEPWSPSSLSSPSLQSNPTSTHLLSPLREFPRSTSVPESIPTPTPMSVYLATRRNSETIIPYARVHVHTPVRRRSRINAESLQPVESGSSDRDPCNPSDSGLSDSVNPSASGTPLPPLIQEGQTQQSYTTLTPQPRIYDPLGRLLPPQLGNKLPGKLLDEYHTFHQKVEWHLQDNYPKKEMTGMATSSDWRRQMMGVIDVGRVNKRSRLGWVWGRVKGDRNKGKVRGAERVRLKKVFTKMGC